MKKWTAILMVVILAVALAACGSKDTNNGEPSNQTGAGNTEVNTNGNGNGNGGSNGGDGEQGEQPGNGGREEGSASKVTVDELIAKSAEASQSLESFAMEATVNQVIGMGEGDTATEQKVDMTMDSKLVRSPLQMYQIMEVGTPQGPQVIEQYIIDDVLYMNSNGQWMKLPSEMNTEMVAAMENSLNPQAQLEQFKTIADQVRITETDKEYILHAELSGDNVKELAKSIMAQSGSGEEQAALLDMMNIQSIAISNGIDKASFYPTFTDVKMSMDMDQEGQKVSMDMNMVSNFSDHNNISIEVPQEALDAPPVG